MADKKLKILTISDHPLVPSGVGGQTKYILEGLLKTGKYSFRSLAGAIKHSSYTPQKLEEYGDDWIIYPVDAYSNENIIREMLDHEEPAALWFMTDPRFFVWLFNMADEIRDRCVPMLYYHVWDAGPTCDFNKPYYDACDHIGCISKLTYNIVTELCGDQKATYIPHAVDGEIYQQFSKEMVLKAKQDTFPEFGEKKFVVFYNSRNARRKRTSDVVKCFKMFLDKVGQDKGYLLMHTDPFDHEGANLVAVAEKYGLRPDQIGFSNKRVPPEQLATFYNCADATICISDNEGFGLSSLESLYCGTPVISNRTGGLQDQNITEDGKEFGVSIVPATRSLQGSQQIPYILSEVCADEDVIAALTKMYEMSFDDRYELGKEAREHVLKNFPISKMVSEWDRIITEHVEKYKKSGNPDRIKLEKI